MLQDASGTYQESDHQESDHPQAGAFVCFAVSQTTVTHALESEIHLSEPTYSQVALCWIRGREKEWKQFVQHRVIEIRELVPVTKWRHCTEIQNPADIPSRGASPLELYSKQDLWMRGPADTPFSEPTQNIEEGTFPKECLTEVKTMKKVTVNLLSSSEHSAV